MTEAYETVKMPVEIGPNQQATLRCKVDTSTGVNVMPLYAFSTYNESTIKQYGMLDTAIDWLETGREEHHQLTTHPMVHS